MVFKIINETTGWDGDLYNAEDFFGVQDDVIQIDPDPPFTLTVNTYSGNDHVSVMSGPQPGFILANYFLGSGHDTLVGSSAGEYFYDQRGNDLVSLGDGNDWAFAGRGDDTINAGGGSKDAVFFRLVFDNLGQSTPNTQGVTFDLAETGAQDLGLFGTDIYRNFERAYGSDGDDRLFGTSGANLLAGIDGDDSLRGREGKDTILGGLGRDTLLGESGADSLYGAFGEAPDLFDGARDVFKFTRTSDSSEDAMDRIYGFETAAAVGRGRDRIDLSRIDATVSQSGNNAFTFVGDAQFKLKSGEVRVIEFGGSTFVYVDIDGDAAAEMVIMVAEITGLTASDFIL